MTMGTTTSMSMRDWEDTIGVPNLDVLQADRQALLEDEDWDEQGAKAAAASGDLDLRHLLKREDGSLYRPGLAFLRARFGMGGSWDAKRKQYRSAIMTQIATKMATEIVHVVKVEKDKRFEHDVPRTFSEAELERIANASPEIERNIAEAEALMALFWRLELKFKELGEEIERGNAIIRYATKFAMGGDPRET